MRGQETSDFIELDKKLLGIPSHEKKIEEFSELDIKVYVESEALTERKLSTQDLIAGIEQISIDQLTDVILESEQTLIV